MYTILPITQAALIDVGNNPLVTLIIVLIVCGIIAMIWRKLLAPLLAKVVDEPWLGAISWIVYGVLILVAVAKVLEVIFGITFFNM